MGGGEQKPSRVNTTAEPWLSPRRLATVGVSAAAMPATILEYPSPASSPGPQPVGPRAVLSSARNRSSSESSS
jgi:hypothetical protein